MIYTLYFPNKKCILSSKYFCVSVCVCVFPLLCFETLFYIWSILYDTFLSCLYIITIIIIIKYKAYIQNPTRHFSLVRIFFQTDSFLLLQLLLSCIPPKYRVARNFFPYTHKLETNLLSPFLLICLYHFSKKKHLNWYSFLF